MVTVTFVNLSKLLSFSGSRFPHCKEQRDLNSKGPSCPKLCESADCCFGDILGSLVHRVQGQSTRQSVLRIDSEVTQEQKGGPGLTGKWPESCPGTATLL